MDTQSQRRSTWKDTLASLFKRRRTNERGHSSGKIKVFLRNPQKFDEISGNFLLQIAIDVCRDIS
jgi:hypothetical protein